MRVMLDTHALLWWLFDEPRLSERAREIIRSPESSVFVSSASAWEIATKHRIGKLPEAGDITDQLPRLIQISRFDELTITIGHALQAGAFEVPHRDPFDRMLAAQSHMENLPLVTRDPVFDEFNVETIRA
jgi:PIN domain nuclease of toxin-antitoxin system